MNDFEGYKGACFISIRGEIVTAGGLLMYSKAHIEWRYPELDLKLRILSRFNYYLDYCIRVPKIKGLVMSGDTTDFVIEVLMTLFTPLKHGNIASGSRNWYGKLNSNR